jgi:hypothetical protein
MATTDGIMAVIQGHYGAAARFFTAAAMFAQAAGPTTESFDLGFDGILTWETSSLYEPDPGWDAWRLDRRLASGWWRGHA